MLKQYDKSEVNIKKLYELINKTDNSEQKDFYAYKLFILLLYLQRHEEAMEVSKKITNDSINDVISFGLMFVDNVHDIIQKHSNSINNLNINVIDNHHKYLVSYIRSMYQFNIGEYDISAKGLLNLIIECKIDEILVEIAIGSFIAVTRKCDNNELFREFYDTFYKHSDLELHSKLVSVIESINNNPDMRDFSIEELIELRSTYSNTKVSFSSFYYGLARELTKKVKYDMSYLVVKTEVGVDAYKFKDDKVSVKHYELKVLKDTIYKKIFKYGEIIYKNLLDTCDKENVVLSDSERSTYDSYLLIPIIDNKKVIAVYTIASNATNLTDFIDYLKKYTELFKTEIINRVNKYVHKLNEQLVGTIDKLVDGYLFEINGIIKLSKGAQNVLGFSSETISTKMLLKKIDMSSEGKIQKLLQSDLSRNTFEILTRDNKIFEIDVDGIKLQNGVIAKIGILRNITEERLNLSHYENLAYVDSLTKLNNYNGLMKSYNEIDEKKETTFINFDINKFKLINDTYGHDTGDVALQFFAGAINRIFVKLEGQVFRKSGDEFIVILGGDITRTQKIDALNELAEYLCDTNNYHSNLPITLTYSAGIASSRSTKKGKEELFKFADLAMYEAKKESTKNSCYVIFDNERLEDYRVYIDKVNSIKDSIDNNTIEITYKYIDSLDETSCCYKVLTAIPSQGLYGRELHELAEKNDLGYSLGVNIVRRIYKEQRKFIEKTNSNIKLHLLLDVHTVANDAFYNIVVREAKEYGINPNTITFSILNLQDSNESASIIERLNNYVKEGFNLSYDFVHTKFPNTSYLDVIDFKYYNMPGNRLDFFDVNLTDKINMHRRYIFCVLSDMNMIPILENVDISEAYDILVNNKINYYSQKGFDKIMTINELIERINKKL